MPEPGPAQKNDNTWYLGLPVVISVLTTAIMVPISWAFETLLLKSKKSFNALEDQGGVTMKTLMACAVAQNAYLHCVMQGMFTRWRDVLSSMLLLKLGFRLNHTSDARVMRGDVQELPPALPPVAKDTRESKKRAGGLKFADEMGTDVMGTDAEPVKHPTVKKTGVPTMQLPKDDVSGTMQAIVSFRRFSQNGASTPKSTSGGFSCSGILSSARGRGKRAIKGKKMDAEMFSSIATEGVDAYTGPYLAVSYMSFNASSMPGDAGTYLSFDAGSRIEVLQEGEPGGWWRGRLGSAEGWFPVGYCTLSGRPMPAAATVAETTGGTPAEAPSNAPTAAPPAAAPAPKDLPFMDFDFMAPGARIAEAYIAFDASSMPGDPGTYLSFDAGARIGVVQEGEPGAWWRGRLDGAEGWFPVGYCTLSGRPLSEVAAAAPTAALPEPGSVAPAADAPAAAAPIKGPKVAVARQAFDAAGVPGDAGTYLTFSRGARIVVVQEGEPGAWWRGRLDGAEGWFPVAFCELEAATEAEVPVQTSPPPQAPAADAKTPTGDKTPTDAKSTAKMPKAVKVAIAQQAFDASNMPGAQGTYLTFSKGARIEVLQEGEPGAWWRGKLDGAEGWFPVGFCKIHERGKSKKDVAGSPNASHRKRSKKKQSDVAVPIELAAELAADPATDAPTVPPSPAAPAENASTEEPHHAPLLASPQAPLSSPPADSAPSGRRSARGWGTPVGEPTPPPSPPAVPAPPPSWERPKNLLCRPCSPPPSPPESAGDGAPWHRRHGRHRVEQV